MAGSAAEKAGIKRGDLIVGFNGRQVSAHSDLPRMVPALAPGTRVEVEFIREDRTENVQVILGKATGGQVPPASKEKKAQPKAQPERQSLDDIDIPDDLGGL